VTVSWWEPVNRAAFRVPLPSATCQRMAATRSGGSRESNRGVPFRSENRALQVEHRSASSWSSTSRLLPFKESRNKSHFGQSRAAMAAVVAGDKTRMDAEAQFDHEEQRCYNR
jgi:hypothetical protein